MAGETAATKRARKPKARRFYKMGPNRRMTAPSGFEVENQTALLQGRRVLAPPPGQRGLPDLPEPPRLVIDKRLGRPPYDVERYHDYWLISDRTKEIFEAVDPEAFAYLKCDVEFAGGAAGPVYWLCDVLRILDAVDEQASRLTIYEDQAGKAYDLMGHASLVFKDEIVGSAHVFRPTHYQVAVFCDQQLKDACKAIGLRGIAFEDALKL
jgi:hypothetical protein